MTGDLDMGANLLENALELRTANMKFDELSVSQMQLRTISTGAFASLRANIEIPSNIQAQASGGVFFQTYPTLLNRHWIFRAYDGSTMQICAYLGGALSGDANFRIPRAGDIIPAITASYDLGSTFVRFNQGWFVDLFASILNASSVYPLNILRIPTYSNASATARNMRYNAGTDTFEIYDGAAWKAH